MGIRKSRRQFVLNTAGIAAVYAAGWGKAPAVAEAAPVPLPAPAPTAPTVNDLMRALVDDLYEEIAEYEPGIDALTQRPMLASVWADLCDLAGEPVPADVDAALDGPAVAALPVPARSALVVSLDNLARLIAESEEKARTGTASERAHMPSLLDAAARQFQFVTDCLDGTLYRRAMGAGQVAA